jgi:hypothetical protein
MSTRRTSLKAPVTSDESTSVKQTALILRKDGALQVGVLRKSFVEGHQLAIGRPSKSGQECIVPDFGRKGPALCVAPPDRLEAGWFPGENDARIAENRVVHSPGLPHRHDCRPNCLRVCGQAQKSLLRQSAERALIARQAVKPALGDRVMDVSDEGQCQPQVNVRQKHLRLPEVPPRARRLAEGFRADRTSPGGMRCADVERAVPLVAEPGTKRSPPCLPATVARPPEQQRRDGLDLGFPYRPFNI